MVAVVAVYMSTPDVAAPRMGTKYGPPGALKARGMSGRRTRRPRHTNAHQNEREECPDARQLTEDFDG